VQPQSTGSNNPAAIPPGDPANPSPLSQWAPWRSKFVSGNCMELVVVNDGLLETIDLCDIYVMLVMFVVYM
jgi:hypothetical protein